MIRLSLLLLMMNCLSLSGQPMKWHCGLLIHSDTIRFELIRNADGSLFIRNGDEEVGMEKRNESADSVEYSLAVFDASLVFPKSTGSKFEGWYRKGDARIPSRGLRMLAGLKSPATFAEPCLSVEGSWPIDFLEDNKVQDKGILILHQKGNQLKGSILTETGDYRFLNGAIRRNKAYLQTFDGGHAYYFRLQFSEDAKSLDGEFLYSQNGKQFFRGRLDNQAKLSGGFSGQVSAEKFQFSGNDVSGKKITQDYFQGKGLVLQVMGSWCPNCLDETRFLVEEYPGRPAGVEFAGLAFERKDDPAYAQERIAIVRRKLAVPYLLLHGGKASKDSASRKLPQVGGVKAFPTTVFIKPDGRILKIHSGFSGPATGVAYEVWQKEFRELLQQIKP